MHAMCCERVQRCRMPAPNCPLDTTRASHDTRLQRDSCSDALTRCAGPPSACHNAHRIQSSDARDPRASSAYSESRKNPSTDLRAVARQPQRNRGLSRPWLLFAQRFTYCNVHAPTGWRAQGPHATAAHRGRMSRRELARTRVSLPHSLRDSAAAGNVNSAGSVRAA